jgi:hypothetical protein
MKFDYVDSKFEKIKLFDFENIKHFSLLISTNISNIPNFIIDDFKYMINK